MSNEDYVECSELAGKTIQKLRLYRSANNEAEIQIDLTDGTSFSCSLRSKPALEAVLFEGGIGTPKIIRSYTE